MLTLDQIVALTAHYPWIHGIGILWHQKHGNMPRLNMFYLMFCVDLTAITRVQQVAGLWKEIRLTQIPQEQRNAARLVYIIPLIYANHENVFFILSTGLTHAITVKMVHLLHILVRCCRVCKKKNTMQYICL